MYTMYLKIDLSGGRNVGAGGKSQYRIFSKRMGILHHEAGEAG
jgi:hypothetical protein